MGLRARPGARARPAGLPCSRTVYDRNTAPIAVSRTSACWCATGEQQLFSSSVKVANFARRQTSRSDTPWTPPPRRPPPRGGTVTGGDAALLEAILRVRFMRGNPLRRVELCFGWGAGCSRATCAYLVWHRCRGPQRTRESVRATKSGQQKSTVRSGLQLFVYITAPFLHFGGPPAPMIDKADHDHRKVSFAAQYRT